MEQIYPLMSTPVSAKHSSFHREDPTDLSLELLEFYAARDSFELANAETPENSFLNSNNGTFYLCRHSPRLLSNGYYVYEEDSIPCDENGNLSMSPTKSTVSYKERIARIFRKRRKPMTNKHQTLLRNNMVVSADEDDVLEADRENFDSSYDTRSENTDVNHPRLESVRPKCKSSTSQAPQVHFSSGGTQCKNKGKNIKQHQLESNQHKSKEVCKLQEQQAHCPSVGIQCKNTEEANVSESHLKSESNKDTMGYTHESQAPEMRFSSGGYLFVKTDGCKFSYEIKQWMAAKQLEDPSVPITFLMTNRDGCKDILTTREPCGRKSCYCLVTLLCACLLISLLARLWLDEVFATLVTYVSLIFLICLVLPLRKKKIKYKVT